MLQKVKSDNKGFTLVELIVVIAILGVLMAVLVPQYIQYVEKSRIGTDESYMGEVAHAMELAAAGSESINGSAVVVTLAAGNGEWAVTKATTVTAAQTAMESELESVLGTANKAGTDGVKAAFKSKYYTSQGGKGIHTLTLDAGTGKVTLTGATKNAIGSYKATAG